MRPSIVVPATLAITIAFTAVIASKEPFPYVAHVVTDDASVRSGPGEEYYETTRLPRGATVEVWRQTPEGWLGVRPPRGSFSLVSAANVRVLPDRVAEVVRPDAPACVGSEFGSNADVIQVLLTEGERIQVLGTITKDGEFWHKIAPPSGEFRWIRAEKVSGSSTYRIARHSAAAGSGSPTDISAGAARGSSSAEATRPTVTLAEIELELATIVAEDPRLWNLAHLRQRCEELLRAATSAERQQEIETVLEKIERFERIGNRKQSLLSRQQEITPESGKQQKAVHDAAVQQTGDTAHDITERTEMGPSWRAARGDDDQRATETALHSDEVVHIPDAPITTETKSNRYDGVGTLRPVVSRRREAPRYALVDAKGDVVTFITPRPGVNLQPYIGQHIGVVGTRGYMPEFKRTHVTAARVTPLR